MTPADLARLTREERALAVQHAEDRAVHPLFCRRHDEPCVMALLLTRLAQARAVVEAAREVARHRAAIVPHDANVFYVRLRNALAAHDAEPPMT